MSARAAGMSRSFRRAADSPARVVIAKVALERIGPKENAKESLIDPPTALIAA